MEPGVIWETVTDESRIQKVKEAFWQHYGDQADKLDGIHLNVKIGEPSSEILDYADDNEIQLIVIPSHGRQGLERFLMGSVAERVVRYAACPVLVLRRVPLEKIAQLEKSLKNS
jgi:nucleotide-binding universal stress UspA family protein